MDESNENFKAAQKKHGDKIATERILIRATGATRSQIRGFAKGLQDFRRLQEQQQREAPAPVPAPRPQFEVKTDISKFDPKPFTLIPETGAAGAGSGDTPGSNATKQVVIIDSGTANFYNIVATFVAAVT